MFLFTTSSPPSRDTAPSRGAGASGPVVEAIRQGAEKTGTGFDYLLATAQRESSLDPTAKAATSSASGLFQFIEQTWLGILKQDGPALGLGAYAEAITAKPQGGYTVSDPTARQTILDLRQDPDVASALAGALTRRNHDALVAELGREPTQGDLYAAHVLGTRGAATLIRAAQFTPARAAATDLPEAAGANRGLFYDKTGRPRGAAELYALLSASRSVAGSAPPAAVPTGTGSVASAFTPEAGSGLRSLFQTDARRGPVSDSVARLWQARGSGTQAAPSYFPRSDGSEAAAAPEATGSVAEAPIAAPTLLSAPLPPARPPEFAAAGRPLASLYRSTANP
ncbi:lytic transglycosylase domain-containing protein [Methylobacterium sp. ID0610]|uniref:lytic transglycosylase domain-containing protein n=1 Tax=Methylobacterium carpenticola TaxID=3344827 RepID=UPI0036B639D1